MKRALLLLFFTPILLSADPWGKDAELSKAPVQSTTTRKARCKTPLLGGFAEAAIRFHQEVISPADGPRSHFFPSSSQYTLESMRTHGFFKGFLMGCDRLMRENNDPWVYRKTQVGLNNIMKYDPVPPPRSLSSCRKES